MVQRCKWIQGQPDYYIAYHDDVWCKPEHNDQLLYKWLLLETFHVGLSWRLVLSKEPAFAIAFDNYDFNKISEYTQVDINRLIEDPGIIRHRGKIEAAINNAQKFLEVRKEWNSFSQYIRHFTKGNIVYHQSDEQVTQNQLSDQVTMSMKAYGFKFIGSVTIYSYLQAIGVINDHDLDCDFR